MRVLFVSSEVFPYSKTGGLGDVAGALPAALAAHGVEVLVVSPWYSSLKGSPTRVAEAEVPFAGGFAPVGVATLESDGVRFAFVGHEDFARGSLYGYPDDVRRFALFSRSVPQVAERLGFEPDLLHVNDWHSGYLPLIVGRGWHLPPAFPGLPSLFTIHNASYQGVSGIDELLHWTRLPGELRDSAIVHEGLANALKAGLSYATRVNTVSPGYAAELVAGEHAAGLEETYRLLGSRLSGVLNGIDVELWDPERDPVLPANYGPKDLAGKQRCKAQLCRAHGLDESRPLMAVVSRLVEQKGIDVVIAGASALVEQGWSLFILGNGDPELERKASELAAGSGHVAVSIGYDEDLAHLAYAAADVLAVPSRFEPCGLSQLIAMRYGTLPLARATGGLRDTIVHGKTGFLFEDPSTPALLAAARQARDRFGRPAWGRMQLRAMARDSSWYRAAESYLALYREAVDDKRNGAPR